MELSKKLELIRLDLGVDKGVFSEKMGFKTSSSYTDLLKGRKQLSINAVQAIINDPDLGVVSLDWLLRDIGSMYLNDKKNIIGDNNQVAIGNSSNSSNYNTTNEELIVLREQNKSLQEQLNLKNEQLQMKDEFIQLLKDK